MNKIPGGVWPTMLTAFTLDNKIDYGTTERLIDWYIKNGADGIFAICQSSEMFCLTFDEKLKLLKFILEVVAGRVPVIASGHTLPNSNECLQELTAIAETGIDALVLITNMLAGEEKSEIRFKEQAEFLMKRLPPHISLGLYECPYPYKYIVSPELLRWCAQTGRFAFLKDTCCDIDLIKEKLQYITGTNMKLYNANSATLLESLRLGCAGYSGVMANFHPQLYRRLVNECTYNTTEIQKLQDFLGVSSLVEYLNYPLCAKLFLKDIIGIEETTRKSFERSLTAADLSQIEQLRSMTALYDRQFKS